MTTPPKNQTVEAMRQRIESGGMGVIPQRLLEAYDELEKMRNEQAAILGAVRADRDALRIRIDELEARVEDAKYRALHQPDWA